MSDVCPDIAGRDLCGGGDLPASVDRAVHDRAGALPDVSPADGLDRRPVLPVRPTAQRSWRFRRNKFIRYRAGWVLFLGVKRLGIQVSWLKYR